MIKSKFILIVLLLFQSTFFVGCNRPETSIENTKKTKTEKISTVSILEKKEKKISGVQFQKTNKLSETDSLPIITNEKMVVITAIFEGETENLKNLTASIISQPNKKSLATTTNLSNNKIIFPKIVSGLKKLRVNVSGENIPKCYSDIFDTENGEDKEVHINLPPGVTIIGTALLPDGSPVTEKFSISVSPSDKSKGKFQSGKILNEQIQPDSYGNFKLLRLAQGFFDIKCELENYKIFKTNLFLTPAETELNFSFSGLLKLEMRGKIINGFDKKPIEGITVYARDWHYEDAYDKDVTDKEGIFSLDLQNNKESDNFFGEITVEEPAFGKIVRQIHSKNKFAMITITLWPAGQITGTITTEKGEPIPGLVVNADNYKFAKSSSYNIKTVSKVNFSKDKYSYQSSPSDIDGKYLIKNVVDSRKLI